MPSRNHREQSSVSGAEAEVLASLSAFEARCVQWHREIPETCDDR